MHELNNRNLFNPISSGHNDKNETSIYVITKPIDCRISINGLCIYIAEYLHYNPQHGIYVFHNRNRNVIKLIYWDCTGFVLVNKRLEEGCFSITMSHQEKAILITQREFNWLFTGLDWCLKTNTPPKFFTHYS